MFVRPFEYLRAESVAEAAAMLAEREDARLLAGGQSLMPMINLGLAQVEAVIDISSLSELAEITAADGTFELGALTRHRALEDDETIRKRQPLLVEAVRHVGNPRVRNVGTLGGSLAHNDPAAELPLIMQVLEAELTLSNGRTTRRVPAADFFVSYFTTALAEDEILTSVHVPALADGWGWGFQEFAARAGDFALGIAAALVRCRDGVIEDIRLGLAGVGDRALRIPAYEAAAKGAPVNRLGEIGQTVEESINPFEDPLVGVEYRRHLVRVLATRAVEDACRRSQAETS
jgi:carbon-monoxide dehydrogenase medium subunit